MPREIPFQKLIDALLDENTPFHPRYLYRLSDLNPGDLARLAEAWPCASVRRRQAIMEDLYELCQNDTLLSFEEVGKLALKDSDPGVRTLGVRILNEFEDLAYMRAFLDLAKRDTDVEVRAASASALGHYIYLGELEELPASILHNIEEVLLQITNSDHATLVRRRALEALGFSSRNEVPSLIETAYNSGDTEWLLTALNAMGRSANERWHTQVIAMLDHLRPIVRAEAASAAGELEISTARQRLLKMLDDDNRDVCMAAIWSLSQIGGEGVRAKLERMLERSDDNDEITLLESALDNLAFTEDTRGLAIFDLQEPEEGEDDMVYYDEGDFESEEEDDDLAGFEEDEEELD